MLFLGHPLTPLLDDRTHVFQPLDGYAALLADLACQRAYQAGGLQPGRSLSGSDNTVRPRRGADRGSLDPRSGRGEISTDRQPTSLNAVCR
jgi:hypothetical protein